MGAKTFIDTPHAFVKLSENKSLDDFLYEFPNTSSRSLSNLKKNNPKKYHAFMIGMLALNLNLDEEDICLMYNIKKKVKEAS